MSALAELRPLLKASADGWRGRLGQGFTPADAGTLVACLLERLETPERARVLITHDGRSDGEAAARHAAGAVRRALPDARIHYLPHLPTPVASARLAAGLADLAILITASHNPAEWNGVKIKVPPGLPLAGEDEAAVDAAYGAARGSAKPCEGVLPAPGDSDAAVAAHIDALAARVGAVRAPRLRVVVDGLHGIGGRSMRLLLERLGHEILSLGEEPLADFGGFSPDPTLAASRERCAARLRAGGADLGLVLDGDGDRMIVLDRAGAAVQPQELLSALIRFSAPAISARLAGPTVATTTCGQMIRRLAAERGSELIEVPVGFKHVTRFLGARPGSVGVGSVGDIGFEAFATDRDPLAVMLLLDAMLAHAQQPLDELVRALREALALEALGWLELHLKGPAAEGGPAALLGRAADAMGWSETRPEETVDGLRLARPGGEWILVRGSTTEGGCRLFGELGRADAARLAAEMAG